MDVKKFNLFRTKNILFVIVLFSIISSCSDSYIPKPLGYFRIDLPEKKFIKFDTTFPYSFEYPIYAIINQKKDGYTEPYWINIDFPKFRGSINVSYKEIKSTDDFKKYVNDAFEFASKHVQKASSINDVIIRNDSARVYGMIYNIDGLGAASTCQFYLTDSTKHFFRGALYFNARPNNDSLAPVIDFIRKDISNLIKTFKWKN